MIYPGNSAPAIDNYPYPRQDEDVYYDDEDDEYDDSDVVYDDYDYRDFTSRARLTTVSPFKNRGRSVNHKSDFQSEWKLWVDVEKHTF